MIKTAGENILADIPESLKNRPTYLGWPIPFITLVDKGVPDFKVTDVSRWREVLDNNMCGLCGHKLPYWMYFIGGPMSVKKRMFFDPAMCEPCARYALEVCPYLLGKKLHGEHVKDHPDYQVEIDKNTSTAPLEMIALMKVRGYKVKNYRGRAYIYASTAVDVEWFDLPRQNREES